MYFGYRKIKRPLCYYEEESNLKIVLIFYWIKRNRQLKITFFINKYVVLITDLKHVLNLIHNNKKFDIHTCFLLIYYILLSHTSTKKSRNIIILYILYSIHALIIHGCCQAVFARTFKYNKNILILFIFFRTRRWKSLAVKDHKFYFNYT